MDTIVVDVGGVEVSFPNIADGVVLDDQTVEIEISGEDVELVLTPIGNAVIPRVVGYLPGPKGETGGMTPELEQARNDAYDYSVAAKSARDLALQYRDDANSAKSTISDYATTASTARNQAVQAKTDTLAARDITIQARDLVTAARDVTTQARDETLTARNTALQAKTDTLIARDDAVQARSDARDARDEAVESAQSLDQAVSDANAAKEAAAGSASSAATDAERAEAAADAAQGVDLTAFARKNANGSDFADVDLARENLGAHPKMDIATAAEAAAGAVTLERSWSPELIREAIMAYAAKIVHEHLISQVVGLQDALDNRSLVGHQHAIAQINNLTETLALLAPKANAALTGLPTAPTAPLGTNTTQIATMAALQAAIANLINGAPGALDTINEIAAALGNDPNFAATILNQLAGKAPLVHRHQVADIDGLTEALEEAQAKQTFYGFSLSADGVQLVMTTDATSDFKAADYATWTVMSGVSFSIVKNALVMQL